MKRALKFSGVVGNALLVAVLSISLIYSGCAKLLTFIEYAEQDIPIAIQMVTNITTLVAPGLSAPLAAAGGTVLAAFQIVCGKPAVGAASCDPGSLIADYQAQCPPTPTGATPACAGILQKIQAGLQAANSKIGDMLNLAKNLPQTTASAIVQGLTLALSTITSIILMIPASASPAQLRAQAKLAGTPPPSPAALRKAFNAAIANQYPGAVLP